MSKMGELDYVELNIFRHLVALRTSGIKSILKIEAAPMLLFRSGSPSTHSTGLKDSWMLLLWGCCKHPMFKYLREEGVNER